MHRSFFLGYHCKLTSSSRTCDGRTGKRSARSCSSVRRRLAAPRGRGLLLSSTRLSVWRLVARPTRAPSRNTHTAPPARPKRRSRTLSGMARTVRAPWLCASPSASGGACAGNKTSQRWVRRVSSQRCISGSTFGAVTGGCSAHGAWRPGRRTRSCGSTRVRVGAWRGGGQGASWFMKDVGGFCIVRVFFLLFEGHRKR